MMDSEISLKLKTWSLAVTLLAFKSIPDKSALATMKEIAKMTLIKALSCFVIMEMLSR